jgi:hypothetical protein
VGVLVVCGGLVTAGVFLFVNTVRGPSETVDAWFTAGRDGDADGFRDAMCAPFRADFSEANFGDDQTTSISWIINGVSIVNDTADVTVDVSYTESGETFDETWTIELVKEGDDWKVCGLTAGPG